MNQKEVYENYNFGKDSRNCGYRLNNLGVLYNFCKIHLNSRKLSWGISKKDGKSIFEKKK